MSEQQVYVLSIPGDYYKIGIAINAEERVRTLQTGNPHKLTLLAQTSAGAWSARDMERRIHDVLQPYRVSGEWFRARLEVIEHAWNLAVQETEDVKPDVRARDLEPVGEPERAPVDVAVGMPGVRENAAGATRNARWRAKNPEAYRAYMRDYMRKRRSASS